MCMHSALDIAHLHSESPPQKRSGMARVLKGFHSFTHTASDCVRPPVTTLWFLPHDGLHLATAHSRLQELELSSMECVIAQCHLRIISVLIPATPGDISVSATTASITLITVSWSWSGCTQYHVNPGVNELNWTARSSAIGMSHTCLAFPAIIGIHLPTPGGWKAE